MSWDTAESTGLIDDYVATIRRAYFATDAKYDNGNTLLMVWECTTDNPDVPEVTLKYSCGKKWSSVDGTVASHEDGADKDFLASSMYGRVINRVAGKLGQREVLESRGNPQEAKVWEGLTFRIKREKIDFGSGIESKVRELPAEAVTSNGSAPATTKTVNPKVEAAKLRNSLKALAKESTSHEEFVDKAMSVDGVADDESLLATVVDPDGIFAEANA